MGRGDVRRAVRAALLTLAILAAATLAIERLGVPELASRAQTDQVRQITTLAIAVLAATLVFILALAEQSLQRRRQAGQHRDLEEQLRLSRQQVAETERAAGIGSWEWELESGRVSWSEEMFHIFGLERNGFQPTLDGYLRRVPSEDREAVRQAIRQAHSRQPFQFEHRLLRPDGEVRIVVERGAAASDSAKGRSRILGITQDVTERRELEGHLQMRREVYLSLLAAQSDLGEGAMMTEGDRILYFNPALEKLFSQQTAIPGSLPDLLEAIDPSGESALRRELELRRQRALPPAQGEAHLPRLGGGSVDLEFVIDSISLADRVRTVALVRDVSERRRADAEVRKSREQLRRFSLELARVREEESLRISREIHDELGQRLTGLKMDLAWVAAKLKRNESRDRPSIVEKTEEMSRLADDTIHEVRRIATELRPGVLDDLGFAAALEWQADEFQRRTGIPCRVTSLPNLVIDSEQSTALFRILQEALTNVSRHARAENVEVRLSEQDRSIVLEIEDDGRGIRDFGTAEPLSLGLLGMQERARLVGGETVVGRGRNGGTLVRVTLPRTPPEAVQDPS
jgi:PAS domain S-box-containing protein